MDGSKILERYLKDTWPVRRRNRPIAPNGRRGQPLDVLTAFSRDAVGIVIFGRFLLVVHHGLIVALSQQNPRGARAQGANGMAFRFTATRPMRLAATLLVLCCASAARAEEASSPTSQQPEGRSRAGHRRDAAGRRTTSPAAGFQYQADAGAARPHARLHRHRRLDPAVRRQGRAAGRYRLYLLPARRHRSR